MPMLRTPRRHEEILTHRTANRKPLVDIESDSCFDVQDGDHNNSHSINHHHNNKHKGININRQLQVAGSPSSSSCPSPGASPRNNSGFFPSPSNSQQKRRRRRKRENTDAWKTVAQTMGTMLVCLSLLGLFLDIHKESVPSTILMETRRIMTTRSESTPPSFQKLSLNAPTSCNQELNVHDVSFTMVTQLSSDRLWMMEYQCQRWQYHNDTVNYPVSIAVLTNDTTTNVKQQLRTMGCDVDNMVTVQTLAASQFSYYDYPVNILRNLALKAVQTSHVMYIDIDFWISQDLAVILQFPEVLDLLATDPKATLVIPAFMLLRQCKQWRECPENNIPEMPVDLNTLKKQILAHSVTRFDPTNRGGHGSTRYKDWFKQNHDDGNTLIEIDCFLSNRYEPYLVFRYCRELPPFQEPFSGYGKNKMTWVMQLRRMGYTFWQLGKGAFVIHYPHLDSPSRIAWNDAPRKLKDPSNQQWLTFKRGRMDRLFVDFREWLRKEIPDETQTPFCEDKLDDDAALRYDREKFQNQTSVQQ